MEPKNPIPIATLLSHSLPIQYKMEPKNPITIATLFALLFHFVLIASQETERSKYGYIERSGKGPENWGLIKEEWAPCHKGGMQSPINLSDETVKLLPDLGRLNITYKPTKATLVNRGHDIMVEWEDGAGSIFVNGTEYFLKQCHWHSPSEHTINGRRFELEGHMVHQSADSTLAVVAILYSIGRPNPFISKLINAIQVIADKEGAKEDLGLIDPTKLEPPSLKYYRYIGSLTAPPCTEGVTWTVLRRVKTVSKQQLALLREAVHDESMENARPTQPSNGRTVHFYAPH